MFKPPVYDKINGPSVLVEMYSEKYKKRFYLFGDRHTIGDFRDKRTINIAEFILENIEYNKDKFIDVFLECVDADWNAIQNVDKLFLTQTCKFFQDFFHRKNKKILKNARIHSLDIRQTASHNFQELPYALLYYEDKVQKQIQNVDDLQVKVLLEEELIKLKTNGESITQEHIITLQNLLGNAMQADQNTFLMMYEVLWTDLYTLARVFRSYEEKEEAQNIIMYAGEMHIHDYVTFLQRLGFEIVYNSIDDLPIQLKKWKFILENTTPDVQYSIQEAVLQDHFYDVEKYTNISFDEKDKKFLEHILESGNSLQNYFLHKLYYIDYKTLHIQNLPQPLFEKGDRKEMISILSRELSRSPEYFKDWTVSELKQRIEALEIPKNKNQLQAYLGNLLKQDPKDYDSWSVEELENRIQHILETEKGLLSMEVDIGYST